MQDNRHSCVDQYSRTTSRFRLVNCTTDTSTPPHTIIQHDVKVIEIRTIEGQVLLQFPLQCLT